jgi:hypothetical protein
LEGAQEGNEGGGGRLILCIFSNVIFVKPSGIWTEMFNFKSLNLNSVQNVDGEYGRISRIPTPIRIRKLNLNI